MDLPRSYRSTDDSEAWHRIMSDDPDEIMPPPESKKEMTEEEKEIITKWIEQEPRGRPLVIFACHQAFHSPNL